jgi:hypothetical protein
VCENQQPSSCCSRTPLSLATVTVGHCIAWCVCAIRITRVTCVFHTRRLRRSVVQSCMVPRASIPCACRYQKQRLCKHKHAPVKPTPLAACVRAHPRNRLSDVPLFKTRASNAEKHGRVPVSSYELLFAATGPRATRSPCCRHRQQSSPAQGNVSALPFNPPRVDPTRIAIACPLLQVARVLF